MPAFPDSEEVRKTVIGLARDLRGIGFAFNTKISYMMFFDWIYPAYTPILHRAVEIWYNDPQVTTPILKLFAELVQNRSQRLQVGAPINSLSAFFLTKTKTKTKAFLRSGTYA